MIDLRQISSNAPQTNVFIKLIIVEVFRKNFVMAGEKISWQMKICQTPAQQAGEKISRQVEVYLPGGQVPKICYFVPWVWKRNMGVGEGYKLLQVW